MTKFDIDFQVGILALMYKDIKFMTYCSANLKPSFFGTKDLMWIFSTFRDYYMNYRACITKRAFIDYVKKSLSKKELSTERVASLKEAFTGVETDVCGDREHLIVRVSDFIRDEMMIAAFEKSKVAYDKGKYEEIPLVFSKAIYDSSYLNKEGQFYPSAQNFRERMSRRSAHMSTIPTGIMDLDSYLRNGGLGIKELGVILAPTSRGKSMFLKHIAEHNLRHHRNCLIFTLEMSEDRYLERFDMSLAEVTASELSSRQEHVERVLTEKEQVFKSRLHIKEYGSKRATVSTLMAYTERLKNGGFYPDFIIIDYADELTAETSFKEERHNISHIYKTLRGWAVESEVPIWTASQANRASLAKKVVTVGDVAEDFSKAQIADVILALCQTKKEYDEQQMRIFIAKNRDSPAKVEVSIDTDFYHGRFYSDIAMI
jgi:replicative DNA helicase